MFIDEVAMKKLFKNVYLRGKKIYLRSLLKSDLTPRYLSWLNSSEVTKYMETGIFPTIERDLEKFYNKINKSKTDVMFAIVSKKNDLHIGNIKIGNINWIHRFADLGIMIGDKKYWGKGYGQEACKLVVDYAFSRLNLNKLLLGVYATHKPAIRTYQKIGFRIEGVLKKMLNLEGKYVDKIIMGILKDEFWKTLPRCL